MNYEHREFSANLLSEPITEKHLFSVALFQDCTRSISSLVYRMDRYKQQQVELEDRTPGFQRWLVKDQEFTMERKQS